MQSSDNIGPDVIANKMSDGLELEQLKRAYAEGKASGEGREIDFDVFLAELKAELSIQGNCLRNV